MTNHLMRGHSSPTWLTVWTHLGESVEHLVPVARTQESLHCREDFTLNFKRILKFRGQRPVSLAPPSTAA